MSNKEIEFAQDTEERRRWFRAASFSHPAKMVLGLQIYLIEHYTKPGETILDPMAGSGTILVACALGRNIVCMELEKKFVKMIEDNWEKIKSLGPMLGYKMGEATILQGDARQLDKLLVDKCIFSPPYADQPEASRTNHGILNHKENCKCNFCRKNRGNKGELQGYRQVDKIVTSPPYAEVMTVGGDQVDREKLKETLKTGKKQDIGSKKNVRYNLDNPNNLANLPYGEISAVISSPPYNEEPTTSESYKRIRSEIGRDTTKPSQKYAKYADAVITSPPYENQLKLGREHGGIVGRETAKGIKSGNLGIPQLYSREPDNIGNLKGETYLKSMLAVYRQCHQVLKDGGLLCLVVKNFIRDKKLVRLDLDTIKLCEKAGFILKERLKRKLTHQSFWRIIYQKKFPDAPKIEFEDVLIFAKARPDGAVERRPMKNRTPVFILT